MTGSPGRYLLAIDAGTGSCRALLFTMEGQQVAVSQREWTHREPPGVPGGQDFDVAANWALITACIRDALRQAGAAGADVAAVAATSMREGIVLYDADGAEIWACPNVDSRAAREAEELIAEGAAERIFAEAGDWVSITSPAQLRWLARHRPDLFGRIHSLGMLSDWIVYRLAGLPDGPASELDAEPAGSVRFDGSRAVIRAARRKGVARFRYARSASFN